jgi:hypothetical protein
VQLEVGVSFAYSVDMRFSALCLHFVRPLLAALAAIAVVVAHAQTYKPKIYSCKDAQGRTITSDRPIPECAGAIRELRQDGATRQEIAAPLTPEQQVIKDQEVAKALVAAQQKREQQLRDKALLMAYSSMDSLETMRSRQIAELVAEIKAGQQRLIAMHKELIAAQAEQKAQPNLTTRTIVRNKAMAMLAEDDLIRTQEEAIKTVKLKFDQDAKRLQELLDPVARSGS